jgi:hypothetical protein
MSCCNAQHGIHQELEPEAQLERLLPELGWEQERLVRACLELVK